MQKSGLSRAVALGLSTVLVGGASIMAAAPAHAGHYFEHEETTVYASDIAADADPYTGWHQGYADGQHSVSSEGLELSGASQVIYGYPETERPSGDDFQSGVEFGQVSWTSTSTSARAFFQVPIFFGADGAEPEFTTLRPAAPVAGTNTTALDQQWVTSRAVGVHPANGSATLEELLAALTTVGNVEVLGFGVLSEAGTESVVTGIDWLDTSFSFLQDPLTAGTVALSGTPTVGSELTATTAGWPAGTTFGYQWFYSGGQFGGAIEGANAANYTVTDAEVGLQVGVIVTGSLEGFSSSDARSETLVATAPKQPAAAAPVAGSDDLAAYLESKGSTPQAQTSTGLPAGELNPGNDYTANVAWTSADSFVDVYLYSTPVLVGTFPVVDGVAQVTLSAEVLSQLGAGAHTLVVTGQTSGDVQSVALSLAAVLAATGFDAAFPLSAAALLLLLGSALVLVRRRQLNV